MDSIVKLSKVSKLYRGVIPTLAIDNITIDILRNQMTSIIGQSGSGKSTLLNLIGTLDTVTSGDLEINGSCISCMTKKELTFFRNRTVGFVFQFHHLLPEFTVLENVLLPRRIAGEIISTGITKKAEKLLEYVGLDRVKNSYSNSISGGQKQRTAIARALINQPKLILADEPTGNLDSTTSNQVFDLFTRINKEEGTTFIIITHDDRIARRTDRRIELKDGRVIFDSAS